MTKISRFLTVLVALLAMTTSAWAGWSINYYVAGNFTNWAANDAYRLAWDETEEAYTATVELAADAQFKVLCVFDENLTWYPGTGSAYGENGELKAAGTYTIHFKPAGNVEGWFAGYFKVEGEEDPNAGTALTPDATGKVWTLDAMPAGDVVLNVVYYPVATATAAPTAATGDIYAGSTTALVTAGTTTQGTMMYAVGTSATEAPNTFSSDVPTAATLTEAGTYYVWYYIMGGAEYSDSEILGPVAVIVKSDKFDLTLSPAPSDKVGVTVDGKSATVTDGKISGVKAGQTVKLKTDGDYIIRKAAVTKTVNMLYIEASNHKLYYMEGETWRQAIDNHTDLNQGWQYGGMELWFGNIVNVLKGNGAAVDPGSVIDPTKTYTL